MHWLPVVHRAALLVCVLLSALLPSAASAAAPRLEMEARIHLDSGEVVQRSVAPGAVLGTGDEGRVRVTAWEEGYLYVIALGSSGSALLLHPFTGPAEPVRGGETIAVPRDGGFLPLDARTGRESVLAFVSDKPLESLSRLLVRLEEADTVAPGTRLRELLAAVGVEAAHLAFGHAPAPAASAMTVAPSNPFTAGGDQAIAGRDVAAVQQASPSTPEPRTVLSKVPALTASTHDPSAESMLPSPFNGRFVPPLPMEAGMHRSDTSADGVASAPPSPPAAAWTLTGMDPPSLTGGDPSGAQELVK